MTQEEISYMPSIDKDIGNLPENKQKSADIFSEHNVSQIKDRKYQNFYLNLTTHRTSQWRTSLSILPPPPKKKENS